MCYQFSIFVFVYRFHGNIDCLTKYMKPNFNPFPVAGETFISIQLREDCLKADWKLLAWSRKHCIETPSAALIVSRVAKCTLEHDGNRRTKSLPNSPICSFCFICFIFFVRKRVRRLRYDVGNAAFLHRNVSFRLFTVIEGIVRIKHSTASELKVDLLLTFGWV